MKKITIGFLTLFLISLLFPIINEQVLAGNEKTENAPEAISEKSMYYDGMEQKTYTYNLEQIKKLNSQKSSIFKVSCNKEKILNDNQITNKKVVTFTLEEEGFDKYFDVRYCNFNMYNTKPVYEQGLISEDEAWKMFDDFTKKNDFKNYVTTKLGKPYIIDKQKYIPYMYAEGEYGNDINAKEANEEYIDGIEVEYTEEEIATKYTNISFVVPFLINGNQIFSHYGEPIGIRVDVSKGGVMSATISLLNFKLTGVKSKKMGITDIEKLVKNGGNSPYYGTEKNIEVSNPTRVFVFNQMFDGVKNDTYLTTGIKLESNIKENEWSNKNYTQIISDYFVGNNM